MLRTDTALLATTQVAALEAGRLKVPKNTTEIIMEVGCSDLATLDEAPIMRHRKSAFLVAFEPLLDKFAVLLARGSHRLHNSADYGSMAASAWDRRIKANLAVPVGVFHKRGMVLPFAILPDGGSTRQMTVAKIAGCSSLRRINEHAKWGALCHTPLENRTVATMSMRSAFELLPPRMPIHLLKLDVQGMDLDLLRAVPSEHWARLLSVQIEVRSARCEPLYQGQDSCEQAAEFMVEKGFARARCPTTCEGDVIFRRPAAGGGGGREGLGGAGGMKGARAARRGDGATR